MPCDHKICIALRNTKGTYTWWCLACGFDIEEMTFEEWELTRLGIRGPECRAT